MGHAVARTYLPPPTKLAEELLIGDVPLRRCVNRGASLPSLCARRSVELREIAEHPEPSVMIAERGFTSSILDTSKLRALAVVMENVPDMLNHGGHNLAEKSRRYGSKGLCLPPYSLFNAAFYGVPQMRSECFCRFCTERSPATSRYRADSLDRITTGYVGSRAVALSYCRQNAAGGRHHYSTHRCRRPTWKRLLPPGKNRGPTSDRCINAVEGRSA